MTIGSLIGGGVFDSVVWGSGVMDATNIVNMITNRKTVKYDVRAVRGPLTKDFLEKAGYNTEKTVIGDPGILMPLIYHPSVRKKKYKYSVIRHLLDEDDINDDRVHLIDIRTKDYKSFVDELVSSEIVISASLHGIILSEAYGIPAVFLSRGVTSQIIKYMDWYYSTGRYSIRIADTIDEAISMQPMELPNLVKLQNELIKSFPYDLWENND